MEAPEHDVPLLRPRELFERPGPIPEIRLRGLTGDPHPALVVRSSTGTADSNESTVSCGPHDTTGACQRSTGASGSTVPIVIGVLIPVMIAAIILVVLHRRHRMIQRKEDAEDKYKSLDFGYDEKLLPKPKKSMRNRKASKKVPQMSANEIRSALKKDRGVSMDLEMTNPYLLPPELQQSRESLHSLSRNLSRGEDKYRATDFIPDDGSIRSPSVRGHRDDSSSFTGSTRKGFRADSRAEALPRPSISDRSRAGSPAPPPPPSKAMLAPPKLPEVDRNSTVSTASSNGQVAALRASNNYLGMFISGGTKKEETKKEEVKLENTTVPTTTVTDLGTTSPGNEPRSPPEAVIRHELPARTSSIYENRFELQGSESFQHLPQGPQLPAISLTPDDKPAEQPKEQPKEYFPEFKAEITQPLDSQPQQRYELDSSNTGHYNQQAEYNNHYQYHQQDSHYQQGQYQADQDYSQHHYPSQQYDQHYSQQYADQETYGNNYHHPTLPNIQVQQHQDDDAASDYYDEEGYDEYADYMGYTYRGSMMGMRPLPPDDPSENPEQRANRIRSFYKEYFDDSTNPAKRQSYFPDDGAFDDVYGYYEQTHPYYRAPSAISDRQRAYSSSGSYGGGPRAYSSMSGRYGGPRMRPKKKLPPPKPLHLLPTPHKLKDDDFIPNAIDYAPPQLFKNQRAGTPDSLRGGMRAYSPSVRPHVPLTSSFDDLAVIPSPHQLRKSGLFTALDFAPPRRLKENGEAMSETGSIRSNRSNISAMRQYNIRAGAYRISRIPKEVAGTKTDIMQSLKPQWDIGR